MVAAAGCCSSRTYMRKCESFVRAQGHNVLSNNSHCRRSHCAVRHKLFAFMRGPEKKGAKGW